MDENTFTRWKYVEYHRDCGHTTRGLDAELIQSMISRELHTCSHKPDHYVTTWPHTCESCSSGYSQPLVGESLEHKAAEIRFLEGEEREFLKQISERNEPLEESVCNMAPKTLGVPHARQIHTLYYQLDCVTSYTHTAQEYNERRDRLDRLEKAMLRFSRSLLRELTADERVYQLKILVKRFLLACCLFEYTYMDLYVTPPDDKEQKIANIDALQEEIEEQIQLQFQLMEDNTIDDPNLKERWSSTRDRFRYEKWKWSGTRNGERYDSYEYSANSDSDDENERPFADPGLGLLPEDEP